MDYRDLRQGIITSMLIASLLGVAGVSPVTANQEAEAKQDILNFVQSRNQQHYMQTLNAHVKELVTLFSSKALQQLQKNNDRSIQGKPLTKLDSNVGIALDKLTDDQRTSLHQLLATALDTGGYQRLTAILNQKFLHQEMAGHDSDLLTDRLPEERLLLTGIPGSHEWGIRLGGPWLNIDLFFDMAEGRNRVSTGPLFMASYPTQVPPAPAIDLSQNSTEIHYPYLRWHEQAGQTVLWQAGHFARTTVKELRSVVRYKTCLNRKALTDECLMIPKLPDSAAFLTPATPTVRIDQLTVAERYYFKRFVKTILENWQPETRDPSDTMEQLNLARLAWAGNPEEQDQGFYLRIQSETLLIELLQTPMTLTTDTMGLPNNATFMVFRDLSSPHDFDPLSNTLKLLNQARKDAEAEKSSAMPHNMETASAAMMMGEPTQNNMRSNDAITWLRDSAYLEGVEIKIGYEGKQVATGTPFYPVVRTRLNGSLHKNMRVSVTLQDQHGQALIVGHPLKYDNERGLYSSALTLPEAMSGTPVIITYSIHQPGSHYEGIYDATVRPDMPLDSAPGSSGRKGM
ncbi:DUF3500 domain-containing protein [Kistimonas asteriae]|uniref:DUF3500 domain-containing protein n=1 Tax=Kistimonas asteriae TaxID=517724 RepID=UPI001BA4E61E|nr:DUF3500 domain-containing protein [Kistimonas asteriae]